MLTLFSLLVKKMKPKNIFAIGGAIFIAVGSGGLCWKVIKLKDDLKKANKDNAVLIEENEELIRELANERIKNKNCTDEQGF